ncbi:MULTISPECIES: WxL domain-containing protein [unclassified Enterococcus]|uniref:WxL domain-containing protein n=1 Tax=unclassified Enterococcus TaxID=2608891 RepID=UPI003F2025CB
MRKLMKKGVLILGTTILILHAFLLPVGIVYAETTEKKEEAQIQGEEQLELPSIKNYLEVEEESEPRFSFSNSHLQGTIESPLKVTFFSDQEVSEARVFLPEEATLLKDQLPTGISVEKGEQSNEWIVQSKRAQNTFVLPLVFDVAGMYEVSVGESSVEIEICDQEETQIDESNSMEGNSDQDVVTEHDLEHQKNSDTQFLDITPRSWNVDNFPLLISRGDQLLRPELIPETYYYVQASNANMSPTASFLRTSDRSAARRERVTADSYILPDIVQDTTGNNLDLFFDVSQASQIDFRDSPGAMWSTSYGTSASITADISLKNSDGLLLEEPIYFYQSDSEYTLFIKKDDLIGIVLLTTGQTLSVSEFGDSYRISVPSGISNKGLILRNGAEFRATSSNAHGFRMFMNRPANSVVKNLAFESFPIEGGNAKSNKTSVFQGETVDISASPNPGYQFSRWEIVSGSGGVIEDVEARNTKFTMGSSDTILRAVFEEIKYEVVLEANPINGGTPEVETFQLSPGEKTVIRANPNQAYDFVRWEIINGEGSTIDDPFNAVTNVTMGNEDTTIRAVYEMKVVSPVDPMNPEIEVDPENKPELPEEQGTLSIDFASRFSFGTQGISAQTKRYYAQPQRLLNADGSINDAEERPNYIQVSDRRPKEERHGWQLAVTQNNQFTDRQDNQLRGARLLLNNQQFASVQESNEPMLQNQDGIVLIPEEKTLLVTAHDGQGAGTWIYRFGNRESAGESVALEVPPTANPRTATYQTTLTWELSAVPDN